jgi:hypothetical protein
MALTEHCRFHIKGWQSSGLKQADYCRREGLNPKTFSRWLKVYLYQVSQAQAVLLPVKVEEAEVDDKVDHKKILLRCSRGYELELPETVSAQWLSALLRGLV